MLQEPWGCCFAELPPGTGSEEEAAQREWIRVSLYLASIAKDAERNMAARRTRPADMLKRFCAQSAFSLIAEFSARPPTLTADGPFLQLATVLYEAVTGVRDANIERACRVIFRSDPARR